MTGSVTEDCPRADERALLQGIITHPEEDAPRLVYADWLDEHEKPERAEFIRVQCALARLAETDPNRGGLVARERHLLARYGPLWQRQLAECGAKTIDFERGFPAAFRICADDLITHAFGLFANNPITSLSVEKINLLGDRFPQFLALPQMARVTSLACHAGMRDSEAVSLAACPRLCHLTKLDLAGNRIGVLGVRALASSAHLDGLRSLCLSRNGLDDEAIHTLVTSPTFTHLRALDLSVNRVTDSGVETIAGASCLSDLDTLDLSANPVGNDGALALARSMSLTALRRVHFLNTHVGPSAAGLVTQACCARSAGGGNRR